MKKLINMALLALMLTLTSCTRAIFLQIFNNTNDTIEAVREGNSKGKHYYAAKGSSVRIQISNTLRMRQNNTTWRYEVTSVPKTATYMASESFGPLVIKLQVEKDGAIYVLAPTTTSAVTVLPPQPNGYPLNPK